MSFIIKYHSEPGSDSPEDYLFENPDDAPVILRKIKTLSEVSIAEWSGRKAKKVTENIWQLSHSRHRILFSLHRHNLVVVHMLKKPNTKKQRKAYLLAERRFSNYIYQFG